MALALAVSSAGAATVPDTAGADPLEGGPALSVSASQPSAIPEVPGTFSGPALPSPPQSPSLTEPPNQPQIPRAPALATAPQIPAAPIGPATVEDRSGSTAGPSTPAVQSSPTGISPVTRRPRPHRAQTLAGGRARDAGRPGNAVRQSEERAPAQLQGARHSRTDTATDSMASRALAFGNPSRQALALSGFERLGDVVQYPARTLMDGFGEEPTAGIMWALPMLGVMLLIALGGFLRLARPL